MKWKRKEKSKERGREKKKWKLTKERIKDVRTQEKQTAYKAK